LAIPIRLPTGELTGCIGVTEAKLSKEFHLSEYMLYGTPEQWSDSS
jgi:hypothetical protein